MSELIYPVKIAKANKTYIMRTIAECLKRGMTHLSIEYKGTYIDLKFIAPDKRYIGFGAIGEITGDSIALELNTMYKGVLQAAQFINEHFYHVKVK
jgi:hypothetical protein